MQPGLCLLQGRFDGIQGLFRLSCCIFRKFSVLEVDADNDGSLTAKEVKDAKLSRNLAFLPHHDLDRFLNQIDLNSDGVITLGELAAALSMPWSPPTVLEPV